MRIPLHLISVHFRTDLPVFVRHGLTEAEMK